MCGNNYTGVFSDASFENTINNNIFKDNKWYGFRNWGGARNLVYNNIFINNTASDTVEPTSTYWNITKTPGENIVGGSYLGGNY